LLLVLRQERALLFGETIASGALGRQRQEPAVDRAVQEDGPDARVGDLEDVEQFALRVGVGWNGGAHTDDAGPVVLRDGNVRIRDERRHRYIHPQLLGLLRSSGRTNSTGSPAFSVEGSRSEVVSAPRFALG